jgi:hypothetical protein
MGIQYTTKLSRRRVLTGTVAAAFAATNFPAPAIGQGATNIKMTLPWLPQDHSCLPSYREIADFGKRAG